MLNLIWDLDGTLIDSAEEVMLALHMAIADAGLDESEMISPLRVGPTIDNILKNSFPSAVLADGKLDRAVKAFRQRYDNSSFEMTVAYPGLDRMLKNARCYTNYVITNKPDLPSGRIIEKLGWKLYIKKLITPYTYNETEKQKKAELFRELVRTENLDPARSYGIGDMEPDCRAAQAAGINTIGVLWGTGTASELGCCDFCCATVPELERLLESLCTK